MRHNSLKFKVSFYLSIVLSIAVVVFPLIFFQHRQEELLKVLSTHVTQISETIVASTRYTMLVNERDVAEQIINDIAKQKNIERVRVISKDGTIIHSNKRAEIGILSEHPTSQSVLGIVDVAYSLDEIDASLNEHAIHFIATSLLCIVIFSVGVGFMLQRLVYVPLNDLEVGAQRVTSGDLAHQIAVRGMRCTLQRQP